jgi:hypothetical protein
MYASSASPKGSLKALYASNQKFRDLHAKFKRTGNWLLLNDFLEFNAQLLPTEVEKLNRFLESGEGDQEWSSSTTVASAATAPSAAAVPSGATAPSAAAVPSGAQTLRALAERDPAFVKDVILYDNSALNPAVRLPLLYKLEKYKVHLSPSEVAKLDTFLETGEGQQEWLPEISRVDPTKFTPNVARGILTSARLLPMTQCPSCHKTCEAASKCSVSGMYH